MTPNGDFAPTGHPWIQTRPDLESNGHGGTWTVADRDQGVVSSRLERELEETLARYRAILASTSTRSLRSTHTGPSRWPAIPCSVFSAGSPRSSSAETSAP